MIDFYQKVGLAWDLKKVSPQLIAAKYNTTGDINLSYKRGDTFWEYFWGLRTMLTPMFVLFAIKWAFSPEWYN